MENSRPTGYHRFRRKSPGGRASSLRNESGQLYIHTDSPMRSSPLWCLTLTAGLLVAGEQRALGQGGATLGFRNETVGPVIVQGVSKVNNMPRRGQPFM